MLIQDIRLRTPDERRAETRPSANVCCHDSSGAVDTLVNASAGWHDDDTAYYLCLASAWAYADLDSFARQLHCSGDMDVVEFVAVTNGNALTVDTTAYLVQSRDRRLAILVFRGTAMTNLTNWLADSGTGTQLFVSEGMVHEGFINSTMVLYDPLVTLLSSALEGHSICEASLRLRSGFRSCTERAPRAQIAPGRRARPAANGMQALYVTGHSLGGALAVLFAALLHEDPVHNPLRDVLRGVYTFGQPMVGDADFARYAQRRFGEKVFRYVYGRDIVPRLPPLTMGRFEHFGQEYASTDEGWARRQEPVRQALTFVGSGLLGVTDWVTQHLSGIPLAQWIPQIPFSLADHDPSRYVRTSLASPRGIEFTWGE
jgi:Lipase (class 3)